MTSSLMEMMLLKELMGNRDNDFTKRFDEFQIWLKERDKKAQEKRPPTFSGTQMFLFVLGLGPIMGILGQLAYGQMLLLSVSQYQNVIEVIKTFH